MLVTLDRRSSEFSFPASLMSFLCACLNNSHAAASETVVNMSM